eukprot:scaffold7688_cov130-Isochrysis_galbana.AAC.6
MDRLAHGGVTACDRLVRHVLGVVKGGLVHEQPARRVQPPSERHEGVARPRVPGIDQPPALPWSAGAAATHRPPSRRAAAPTAASELALPQCTNRNSTRECSLAAASRSQVPRARGPTTRSGGTARRGPAPSLASAWAQPLFAPKDPLISRIRKRPKWWSACMCEIQTSSSELTTREADTPNRRCSEASVPSPQSNRMPPEVPSGSQPSAAAAGGAAAGTSAAADVAGAPDRGSSNRKLLTLRYLAGIAAPVPRKTSSARLARTTAAAALSPSGCASSAAAVCPPAAPAATAPSATTAATPSPTGGCPPPAGRKAAITFACHDPGGWSSCAGRLLRLCGKSARAETSMVSSNGSSDTLLPEEVHQWRSRGSSSWLSPALSRGRRTIRLSMSAATQPGGTATGWAAVPGAADPAAVWARARGGGKMPEWRLPSLSCRRADATNAKRWGCGAWCSTSCSVRSGKEEHR